MSTILERRREQLGRAKARQAMKCKECDLETTVCQTCGKCSDCCFCVKHGYFGQHNVWYGETVHDCECGFSSHEKSEVLAHVKQAEQAGAMDENEWDARAGTR